MNFGELTHDLKKVPYDERRKEFEGYFEFVMSTNDLLHLYPVLEKHFGAPFKPAGIEPTGKAHDYAKQFGGIRKHQVLYYREGSGLSNCAMVWPWNDGSRATVKVAQGRHP